MKKSVFALAALAAIGFSGVAFAEDANTGATAAMSDTEMDNVAAGRAFVSGRGPDVSVTLPPQAAKGGGWINGKGNIKSFEGRAANLSAGGS